uniref:Uncharacterized protein n=1 Tax=Hyaloperonospora arabidopsidis (strain Emoy2) TaxID=559515 RepID=M4BGU0_HYAAE
MFGRVAIRSRGVLAHLQTTRSFAKKVSPAQTVLRPIHFERDEEDWEYPTRVEADEKKKNRVVRNRFGHPNFISLWVDKLNEVEGYLKEQGVPYSSEGIVQGPDSHDVLVIPPSDDGSSVEFFNLCDNPTMVELVQAPLDVIKEFEDDNEEEV